MTDTPDDERLCVACLAESVAGDVLREFTEIHPEVTMSYAAWMTLGFTIEETIKAALGVADPELNVEEKVTVQ